MGYLSSSINIQHIHDGTLFDFHILMLTNFQPKVDTVTKIPSVLSDSQWQAILDSISAMETLPVDLSIQAVEVYSWKVLQIAGR